MKKKTIYKITAATLAVAIGLGTATTTALSYAKEDADTVIEAEDINSAETDADGSTENDQTKAPVTVSDTAGRDSDAEIKKDETVYVLAGADGSVQKVIVSDWISNASAASTISDYSELSDIQVVKGDESFVMNDSATVWDTQGNDIYYQGTGTKELPVSLSVSYTLDGKAITPQELAGKSGKVTIRFDYKNNQYEMVEIAGKEEKIYVPFVMMTGLVVDSDSFKNIEVSNGKLINDGNRSMIMGIAFPGLQESLGLDTDKLELPDYIEITADVDNFELATTVTLATNELFSKAEKPEIVSEEDITGAINKLDEVMSQLVDGSSQLYDGMCTLLDKSGELVEGINKLAEGAAKLKQGGAELQTGANQLSSGAGQLSSGLNQLASNNAALNGGAKQVFDTLLATATSSLNDKGLSVPTLTIDNYAAVLTQVISSLDSNAVYAQALAQVTAAVEAKRPEITAGVTAAVKASVTESVVLSVTGLDMDSYNAAVEAGLIDSATVAGINAAVDAQMATDSVIATINSNVEAKIAELISTNMQSPEVQAQLAAANAGAQAVIELKTSLDSYKSFYTGLQTYTAGVATAASGASELSSGAGRLSAGVATLNDGIGQLTDGIFALKDGAPALIDGITQLKDGSMQLSDGLNQFNEEGIQKILSAVDDNLGSVTERLEAISTVSKNYKNYSGIDDSMDGDVKFIYKTDAVTAE